jgi:hypothetical protein
MLLLQFFVSPFWVADCAGGMLRFLSLRAVLIRSCFSDKNIRTAAAIDGGVELTSWNFCEVEEGAFLVNPFNK